MNIIKELILMLIVGICIAFNVAVMAPLAVVFAFWHLLRHCYDGGERLFECYREFTLKNTKRWLTVVKEIYHQDTRPGSE